MGFLQQAKTDKTNQPVAIQYLPPENQSDIALNSTLITSHNLITSTLLDLAVRHNISIHELEAEKGLFGFKGKPKYKLEFLTDSGMTDNEKQFLRYFINFPSEKTFTIDPSKTNSTLTGNLQKFNQQAYDRAKEFGYFKDIAQPRKKAVLTLLVAMALIFVPLILPNFSMLLDFVTIARIAGLAVVVFVLIIFVVAVRPLTLKGSEAKDHLKGLKDYVKLSETERIDYLQSQTGALKGKDGKVALYERVLPYAVMFGLEKSWAKVMEVAYQENPEYTPTWFYGTGPFSADSFADSLNSFAPSVDAASSYTDSGSGSGGGGSSGGGGGGGGGGGW